MGFAALNPSYGLLWVVEVIAPFGGAEEMVKDLKAKVFATKQMKFLSVEQAGKKVWTL